MLKLVQWTVGPSIEFRSVGMGGLWPALVDPSELENALRNHEQLDPSLSVPTKPFAVDTLAARVHEMISGCA